MGQVTNTGRAIRHIDFKNAHISIWCALARTTKWPDENFPPVEDIHLSTLDEIIGLKLFTIASMVVEDENGLILFGSKKYTKVSDESAIANQSPYLYLQFEIQPDEFAGIDYRQVGVFMDSIPKSGFGSFQALTADKFSTLGKLIYVSNQVKQTRYPNTRHVVEFLLP